ncbi:MAG: nickel pincer cofactor biosynthesis protein LarC [Pyrinomonadaceae bacterium]
MGKALFLDSVAGVAGDMFVAAFIDAGLVTPEELDGLVRHLGLNGVVVEIDSAIRATVAAKHLKVTWQDEGWKQRFSHEHDGGKGAHRHDHHRENTNLLLGGDVEHHWHTHYGDVDSLIASSSLDEPTKDLSRNIFSLLAKAEAVAHGIDVEKVAFHEVGTIDSIMDVVSAAYCIEKTGITNIYATPIKPGRGLVTMQHGTHPVPPPASIRLLEGMQIAATPTGITRENVELSTPTGIAIIKALSPQFADGVPAGTIINQGMGAGSMDLGNYPNVFRIVVVETDGADNRLPYLQDSVVEIVCNIDDDTAENIAWLAERLLANGALDVWQTPAIGKKGRMMTCLSVLAEEASWDEFSDWILRNSTTFGIRYRKWDRLILTREIETRGKDGRIVRYKIGSTVHGEKLKEKAEFEDRKA